MKFLKSRLKWLLPLLLVFVIGTAAASFTLFTHIFPAVTTTAPAVTTTCGTPPGNTLTLTPSTAPVGGSGFILGQCPLGAVAFHVAIATTPITATFSLPTGYTALAAVFHHTTNLSCTTTEVGAVILTSGVPTTALGISDNDYCVAVTNAPVGSLASFTVTWSQ